VEGWLSHTFFNQIVLAANLLWFGAGFNLFGLSPKKAMRIIRPDIAAGDDKTLLASQVLPFLGGMNLAFAALAAITLYKSFAGLSCQAYQIVFLASAFAHGTQFIFNIPNLVKGGLKSGGPWDVLKGLMLLIFIVDFVSTLLNLTAWISHL